MRLATRLAAATLAAFILTGCAGSDDTATTPAPATASATSATPDQTPDATRSAASAPVEPDGPTLQITLEGGLPTTASAVPTSRTAAITASPKPMTLSSQMLPVPNNCAIRPPMMDPTRPRVARMPRFCLPGLIRRARAPMMSPATRMSAPGCRGRASMTRLVPARRVRLSNLVVSPVDRDLRVGRPCGVDGQLGDPAAGEGSDFDGGRVHLDVFARHGGRGRGGR
jgi:hypothetical protein